MGEAVFAGVAMELFLEGAEEAVEDDEGAAVVAVDVQRVGGVVDAVVAGRVEQPLHPSRQLRDGAGVDPKLIDAVEMRHCREHVRREEEAQGRVEDEGRRVLERPLS